jgi:nitroimidazol reductase NimA-like FMN-containing flavoprotein (pyridoxamine 5'-phosphate oxidase superfamily)
MPDTPPSARTEVKRLPDRAAYDRETVEAILDEGFVCHVAFVTDGGPVVIPTIYGRLGDFLYLHGSSASRMLRQLKRGVEASVSVTHVDGLVLARSAFHHSLNFRSVVLFGTAVEVTDAGEKLAALQAIVEHVVPKRWQDVRGPTSQEFLRTLVLRLPLSEASAKVRTGPPLVDEEDYSLGCWAGVIPIHSEYGEPVDDPRLAAGISPPDYVSGYRRPGAGRP